MKLSIFWKSSWLGHIKNTAYFYIQKSYIIDVPLGSKYASDSGSEIDHKDLRRTFFCAFNSAWWFLSFSFFRLCIKPGIQERGTECREPGEWGECYIPGNVAKHSVECPQTFRGMSSNIPGNVAKHSGECPKTFRGMSPNIPGNVPKIPENVAKLPSLISECFTVHYVLISSNQSEYLYSCPVCKNVLKGNILVSAFLDYCCWAVPALAVLVLSKFGFCNVLQNKCS